MASFKEQGHEQATSPSKNPTPISKQDTPTKKNPFADFTVGNWSADIWDDEDLWDEDEDINTSNDDSCSSASTSGPTTPPSSSDSKDNWQNLDHEESLIHRLDGLALKQAAEDQEPLSHTTSESGDDDLSPAEQAQQVFYAQRTLVFRAICPIRRDRLEPRRKGIPLSTSPLRLPAGKKPCPKCSSTVFRSVLDHCSICASQKAKNELYDIQSQHQRDDTEDRRRDAEICERKAAIEILDPEDYAEELEWQDLRSEQVDMKEESIERKAGFEVRVSELENEVQQYGKWLSEDLERAR